MNRGFSDFLLVQIFFAWQFGPQSCFFHGRSSSGGFSESDWTWVIALIATTVAFIHLSLVTLPTYSLVVNMGRVHWHKDLLPENVRESLFMLANRVRSQLVFDIHIYSHHAGRHI